LANKFTAVDAAAPNRYASFIFPRIRWLQFLFSSCGIHDIVSKNSWSAGHHGTFTFYQFLRFVAAEIQYEANLIYSKSWKTRTLALFFR